MNKSAHTAKASAGRGAAPSELRTRSATTSRSFAGSFPRVWGKSIAVLLGLPLALGACLSWLERGPDPDPPASSDRSALYHAAVAAFADGESGYAVGDMDPDEGWFLLNRVEEWRTGDEAVEVDVRLESDDGGRAHVVVAVATRRSLLRSEDARNAEGEAETDVARRFRDSDVERDVLERIRASVERFRVPRASG